jgi:nicotinamidase-related amidase
MIRQLLKSRRKQVLVDVGTQKDLFLDNGSSCIRNHRRVLANVRRMMAWARHEDIRIISTCEVYPNHNGGSVVHYCLDGTDGQKKIRYTLLNRRVSFPADGNTDLPLDILRQYDQIILYNRSTDPFDEPRTERLLTEVKADNFVVMGADAAGAVKAMALGLLQRGKKVIVIVDAVGAHNNRDAELALRKMQAKGAKLIETKDIAGFSHLRKVGICHCGSCQGKTRKIQPELYN